MRNEPWVAEGGECRDKQRGSSASEVSTDDGTANKKLKVPGERNENTLVRQCILET